MTSDGAIYQAVSRASTTLEEERDMEKEIKKALAVSWLNRHAQAEAGVSEMPGFKEGDTSREAAEGMRKRAPRLRAAVLACIRSFPGRTADEIAAALGETPWAIRPRVSELRKAGLVVNEGRGVNASGKAAHRWRAA
jgi:hypothetical protein